MFVTHATGSWWPPLPETQTSLTGLYRVMFVTHATGSWWPPIPDIETGFLGVYLITCPASETGAFGAVLCSRFKHMQQTHGAILNLLDPYSHGHTIW